MSDPARKMSTGSSEQDAHGHWRPAAFTFTFKNAAPLQANM